MYIVHVSGWTLNDHLLFRVVQISLRYIVRNAISRFSCSPSLSVSLFRLLLFRSTDTLSSCVCACACMPVGLCVHIFNSKEFSVNGAICVCVSVSMQTLRVCEYTFGVVCATVNKLTNHQNYSHFPCKTL